jgi:hypothetical protein
LADFKATFQQIFFEEDDYFQEFMNYLSTKESENERYNE